MSDRWNDVTNPPSRNATNPTRRRILRSVCASTVLGSAAIGSAGARMAADEHEPDTRIETLALEQNGACVELTPLRGDEPVEDLYDYTYPQDRFEGQPGSDGDTFSSEGTSELQIDHGSILFFYQGPEGLSLVLVHGKVDGFHDGGTVSFRIDGLPDDGEWVVQDDYYLREDGEEAPSNFDIWDVEHNPQVVHWAFRSGRTDGGVFRGFDDEVEFIIEPAFNDRAGLYDEYDFGTIERWEALSGSLDDPDRIELDMDRPIRITDGTCPG